MKLSIKLRPFLSNLSKFNMISCFKFISDVFSKIAVANTRQQYFYDKKHILIHIH